MIDRLKKDSNLMISPDLTTVINKIRPNQKCRCGSKKAYKKCECFEEDRERTREFIEGKSKELEKAKNVNRAKSSKGGGIIIV